MNSGFRGVWQVPALRKLAISRFISNFGNGIAPVAISFGVLGLPGGNARALSTVWAAGLIPVVALTLIGGVIADKMPRAKLVGGADFLLGILISLNAISLITGHGSVLIFVVVGFLGGCLNAMWYPAMGALASDLADEKILQESNSTMALASNVALIFGTSIGGILVATVGAGWAILIDAISFIFAGALVFSLRHLTPIAKSVTESTIRELRSGWQEFLRHRWIVAIVAASAFMYGCERAVYLVIGPIVAKENLGGPKPWSFILTCWAIGSVVGVIFAGKFRPKYPIRFALLTQFPTVLWTLALGHTTSIPLIAISAFAVGFAVDIFYVIWITAIQQHVAKESLSKVVAIDAWGAQSLSPIIMAVAGPITVALGSRTSLNYFGLLLLISITLPFLVKEVRALKAV